MPRVPCPARPKEVTRTSFFEATLGKAKAKKFLKAEESRRQKLRKKQKPERKQQLKDNYKAYSMKPENKERKKVTNQKPLPGK